MKKHNLFSSIAFVFSAVLLVVSGAILVHSQQMQTTQTTLDITYVADNVSFTASAFYQLADTGAKVDLVDTSNNNATSVTFTPSTNSTTKTLSATADIGLTVNKQYVLFTYAFTNTASIGGYCIKVSLTDGTTSFSNVTVKYLASSTKYCAGATPTTSELTSFKSSVSSTSAPTNVYIEAQETKYFYLLIEVDNAFLNSQYDSTATHGLVWNVVSTNLVDAPEELVETPISCFTYTNNEGWLTITGINGALPNEKLLFPDSVDEIGDGAFANCTSITDLYFPSSIAVIGNDAFSGCTRLTSISFSGCQDVEFGDGAFYNCTSLITVDVEDLDDWMSYVFESADANPLIYAGNLYEDGTLVTSLTLGGGVGDYAFAGCTSITSINASSSYATSIGHKAFYYCTNLTGSLSLPYVSTLGYGAFQCCSDITSLSIGSALAIVSDYAFASCSSLATVSIGPALEEVSAFAFAFCSDLVTFTSTSPNYDMDSNAFFGTSFTP